MARQIDELCLVHQTFRHLDRQINQQILECLYQFINGVLERKKKLEWINKNQDRYKPGYLQIETITSTYQIREKYNFALGLVQFFLKKRSYLALADLFGWKNCCSSFLDFFFFNFFMGGVPFFTYMEYFFITHRFITLVR